MATTIQKIDDVISLLEKKSDAYDKKIRTHTIDAVVRMKKERSGWGSMKKGERGEYQEHDVRVSTV